MSDNRSQIAPSDEMDLIELVVELWTQKIIILLSLLFCVVVAIGYCAMVKPIYTSQIVVAPGPINLYGAIAGEFKRELHRSPGSPISLGATLSNDAFRLYLANFESIQVRSAFHDQAKQLYPYVSIQVRKGRNTQFLDESATVIAESADGETAKKYLEALVSYVSAMTVSQLNEYFIAMDINQAVTPAALFKVEQAATVSNSPIRPKRALALALGVVLGAMIGVFLALVRLILKRRSKVPFDINCG